MNETFRQHLVIAKGYFSKKLPYWCSDFSRPTDQQFGEFLRSNGYRVQYLVLELWDQVYIPLDCNFEVVEETARVRARLRDEGVHEDDLPILIQPEQR
ncbi:MULTISPECIES: hypothetical protein [unclassified Pseudomonas]|uniref:hypothetical protein n=1 Tax=unclassified Pseudomonas TaxID=196821 RepID=UPI00128CCC1F|nr:MULTISPECIES: hypothetical protein [unclassified Pseudomonas]MPQ71046.1 hypothetical protein [Pseudomonas sp. MWU12-2323]